MSARFSKRLKGDFASERPTKTSEDAHIDDVAGGRYFQGATTSCRLLMATDQKGNCESSTSLNSENEVLRLCRLMLRGFLEEDLSYTH